MDKIAYYRSQGIRLMNLIENMSGMVISELDRELENGFWAAELCGDGKSLRSAYFKLAALHDQLMFDEE